MYLPPYSPDLNPIEEAFSAFLKANEEIATTSRDYFINSLWQCNTTRLYGMVSEFRVFQ